MSLRRWLSTRDLVVLLTGLVAIAGVTALLRSLPGISPTTVALTLLLVVLGAATQGRLRAAAIVSVVATLAINFFFIPPVGTFTVADAQNWVALLVFLLVALIASRLSAAAQERAREAIARRNEVTRLFDLTRDVLLTTDTAGAIEAVVRHVARRFELEQVAIYLPADHGWRACQGGREDVTVEAGVLSAALAKAEGTLHHGVYLVPLRHGAKAVGLLATGAPAIDAGTLDAVAGVVAIAIERAQFLAERDAAELAHQKAEWAATLLASLSHDLRTPLTATRVAVENLRGALSHLLENAARYSPAEKEIDVRARVAPEGLHVSVTDLGPGLAPGELDHLFERFYRGRAARQTTVGTGMGLSITRGLLAAVGGRVWAENVAGAGARFSIVVPGPVRAMAVTE